MSGCETTTARGRSPMLSLVLYLSRYLGPSQPTGGLKFSKSVVPLAYGRSIAMPNPTVMRHQNMIHELALGALTVPKSSGNLENCP